MNPPPRCRSQWTCTVCASPAGARPARYSARRVGIAVFAALIVAHGRGAGVRDHELRPLVVPEQLGSRASRRSRPRSRDLRGLAFEHPVPIRYLAAKDFEKELGADDKPSAAERARDRERGGGAAARSGSIGGKVDLGAGVDTSQKSSTLAFYDPASQEIFVRGTTLDVEHRVTIAHELTHVLQDQHFDLQKLQKRAADSKTGDATALQALVEGDAVRIQDDYLEHLTSADQAGVRPRGRGRGQRGSTRRPRRSPTSSAVARARRTSSGPSTIRVLIASGGNSRRRRRAHRSDSVDEDVHRARRPRAADSVDDPLLPAGAVAQETAESFGSVRDVPHALDAVDPARRARRPPTSSPAAAR